MKDELVKLIGSALLPDNFPVSNSVFGQVKDFAKVSEILGKEYFQNRKISNALIEYNKDLPSSERLRGDNIDKYFHQRGMYQAAQLGAQPAAIALKLGDVKEMWDGFRNRYIRGWDKQQVEQEKQKDLKNNYDAVIMGLNNKIPVEEAIQMPPTVQRLIEAMADKK